MELPRKFVPRKVRIAAVGCCLLILGMAACGDDEPTAPDMSRVKTIVVAAPTTGIAVGDTIMLKSEALAEDGTVADVAVTWTSHPQSVAMVDDRGLVTGLSRGLATVTASAGDVVGELAITVGSTPADLTTIVDSVRAAFGVPGMAGAIVTVTDGLWAVGVSGSRRMDRGGAITIQNRWHLGSNTKAMTAVLAAIAVDDGMLEWTTTLRDALPDLDIHADLETVTLEELLSMQSGISTTGTYGSGSSAREQRDNLLRTALPNPPSGERGTYDYTNISYIVAGAMVERAYNVDYEQLLQEKVWQPLGLANAGWGPTDGVGLGAAQPVGHVWTDGQWVPCRRCDNPPGLGPAGRAHMSIVDWAAVIQEFMQIGAGTSGLVSSENGARLFAPAVLRPDGDMYGLGWRVTTRSWGGGTGETVTHGGSNIRNHSTAWVGLGSGVAFIATTNAYRASPAPSTLSALNTLVVEMLDYHAQHGDP